MTVARQQEGFQKLQNAFLLLASHEIKTPLTAIRGYSELLLRKRDKVTANSSYQAWIVNIYQESLRLSEYIQKLLAQNQTEIVYDFDFINMEAFIKKQFPEEKYTLKITVQDQFHVFASAHSLHRIFRSIFNEITKEKKAPIEVVLKSRNSYHSVEICVQPDFETKPLFEKRFEKMRKELFLQYGLLNTNYQEQKISFQMRFPKIQLSN